MAFNRALLIILALVIEASLLTLSGWQLQRYQHRLAQHAQRQAAPQIHLTGTPLNYVFLTNQPNPQGDDAGRRLIVALQTANGVRLADLGWKRNPPVPTAPPNFAAYDTPLLEVTGIQLPLPQRRGWLQGPTFATHAQLLAFLEPMAVTPQPVGDTYVAATQTSPTLPGITALPPALRAPATHLGYALQWLTMAILFPALCWNFSKRATPSRRRKPVKKTIRR